MVNGDSRPDPDRLLARINSTQKPPLRGKLKIFLGYAAGVGKTYAMLEAAHQRKNDGVDVVVGYIETHGREETEALLGDLEIIPRKQIEYRAITLPEVNIDAILSRHPQLVLVDELAHTNAPGSRHLKRYQDVQELLVSGINVYTTLNVQHLESLNDVISQITGVKVRETIPDRVIDDVDELELVDLPPEELLVRLREGKVYVPEQAARAIEKFFRLGNLTALRELTMRRAAERVDDQMRAYMQTRAIPGPWPASERLMVCLSPNPLAERLVRSTRRLADELNAEWLAVYVETPDQAHLSGEERVQISKFLRLAEELGGRAITVQGSSVVEMLIRVAQENNITKIIAGRPLRPRWKEFVNGSIVDRLVRSSGNIDVYIVSSEGQPSNFHPEVARRPRAPWVNYLLAVLITLGATFIGVFFRQIVSPTNLVMVYLLAVVLAAAYLGRGPALLVSFLGVLAFDFFLVTPYLTFAVSDTEYILTFVGLLGVGLVISALTARARDQAVVAQRREMETGMLYALSRDLSVAEGMDEITRAITTSIGQAFGREVILFLPEGQEDRELKAYQPPAGFTLDQNETAVAAWVFQNGQSAGRGTDTLASSDYRYIPLKTSQGVVGVLGIKPKDDTSYLTADQRRLLDSFASQAAIAIEHARLAEQLQQAQFLRVTERLQTALLNSISHDLRTPLVSIIGALSSLAEGNAALEADTQQSLIENALQEADRMNHLIGNLLNMSRLEAGVMKITRQTSDFLDVIGTALENRSDHLLGHRVNVDVPDNLPMVAIDFVLMVQVMTNLIDNSIKYSPEDTEIDIKVKHVDDMIQVRVRDHGMGIPPDSLEHIFDKFYRVQRPESITGTGLGLSICKGIIEAHGGQIWAENCSDGGTAISFYLPVGKEVGGA